MTLSHIIMINLHNVINNGESSYQAISDWDITLTTESVKRAVFCAAWIAAWSPWSVEMA